MTAAGVVLLSGWECNERGGRGDAEDAEILFFDLRIKAQSVLRANLTSLPQLD